MTKNLTRFKELCQQAREKTYKVTDEVAGDFVPKMYDELIDQGFNPYRARRMVEKECAKIGWRLTTIVKHIPDEAKDQDQAEKGRKSAEMKRKLNLSKLTISIFVSQKQLFGMVMASQSSNDGSIWIQANSEQVFLQAVPDKPITEAPEPVTPKSATEPLTVKPARTGSPIRAK